MSPFAPRLCGTGGSEAVVIDVADGAASLGGPGRGLTDEALLLGGGMDRAVRLTIAEGVPKASHRWRCFELLLEQDDRWAGWKGLFLRGVALVLEHAEDIARGPDVATGWQLPPHCLNWSATS